MSSNTSPKPGPTPGPRPGPRPGAVPGPRPGAHAAHSAPAVAVAPQNDPSKWGRVEEDGTVFVTYKGVDREIGSWQAGTPAEGLAHYGARFDDAATEVALLEARLNTHPGDADHIKRKAAEILETLPTAAFIGDIESLERRLGTIINGADDAGEKAREEKQQHRIKAIARKEELAAEAEDLAENSTDWKAAGDRIREILDEWKSIKGIDRKTDDELWKRYSRARDAFNRRRGSHFAELDRGRAAARKVKEELVAKANEIKNSTDWNDTAKTFRDLMTSWKTAGRAPREVDDKLWNAFKEAQDYFFNARHAVNEERDREFSANADAKDALLAEYSQLIDPSKDLDAARKKLRELQEKWEEIGYVPRDRVREFEDKISKLERRVEDAADAQWRRTDPEAQARASQFTAKVEEFNAQAAEAEAKGNSKKAAQLREQAQQWQEWANAALNAVENR
ncbi:MULTISPECIES: DUF349 domain-containing protein [Corynebacterium]|uniref:DNA repair ATPase n=1 Tax=Corynebacterium ramonii TaxID=3026968 RepID=A0ABN4EHT5_9CORY|nr:MULTISPECIES: DUF349 domain-containing protein [Corynebacterium]AIU32898.1 Hypothetical protein CulFRC11_1329 [Corynebacterium ramonii FRC0011]AKA96868.1 Hypothetical protein CUL131002_1343 [Corynebacterium ulcerans]ESU57727.1 hypothetical protein D881_08030 [Corynebacterium ulcerans NCTC 12077]STC84681.1 Domain of Uncharacterised Function (DUF349) [Corynebacterium ulcerans]